MHFQPNGIQSKPRDKATSNSEMPLRPSKRRKVDDDATDSVKKIVKLEEDLKRAIEDGSSLNALADLLAEAKKSVDQPHAERLHKAIYALYRVFSLLISDERFHSSSRRTSEEDLIVRKWLMQRLDQYLNFLSTLFVHPEPLISVRASIFTQYYFTYDTFRNPPPKSPSLCSSSFRPHSQPLQVTLRYTVGYFV